MARNGVNKVILVGNLGQAPEIRYLPNGSPVATFSIATSESWKDRETEEIKEQTEWHRVVCYRKLAEIAEKFLSKGIKVYIEGRLRTRKWKDNAGNDRTTTEIQVDDLRMLEARRGAGDAMGGAESSAAEKSANTRAPHEAKFASGNTAPASNFSDLENMEFDDDIPF